ncbi:MAG: hypothetical protein ACRYF9_25465 [Janthinobacterium lividum]
MHNPMLRHANDFAPFIALRRQIHAVPELSGDTLHTAELVAAKLQE